jgi:hypothetical protein
MVRQRLIAAVFGVGAIAAGASVTSAAPSALPDGVTANDRIFLSCTGSMSAGGQDAPVGDRAGAVVANGLVDLAAMRVTGFGLGAEPIVALTAAMIAFGAAAAPNADGVTKVADKRKPDRGRPGSDSGTVVDGSIDRATGATTILVRSADDETRVIIAMSLTCTGAPAPFG